jgi:hypothetical protein
MDLGYNPIKIFYPYPMIELFSTIGNSSNTLLHLGSTNGEPST